MQASEQGPQQEPQGQGPEATAIAEQARKAASAGGGGDSMTGLKEAISAAGPDERSAAAKELVEEQPAYQLLHKALTEMGIQPEEARNETGG